MEIGQGIKSFRKKKGLTQKQLAELTGLAVITIQGYEAEKFSPKVEQIEKLAKALDVTPFDLIGFDYWDEAANTEQLVKPPLSEYSTSELLAEIERRCLIGTRKEF